MITIECIEILNGVEIKQINACTHINHNLFWNWEQMYSKNVIQNNNGFEQEYKCMWCQSI